MKREDRQQVDRAPGPEQAKLMDPERARRFRHHQTYPDPAHDPVRQRSLGRGELDDAEREGGDGSQSMKRS